MSGHSKWATIKRKKGASDVARGQLFSKLSRLITLAVAEGGGATDPDANVKLRFAVDRARTENMPKENIARAIAKGAGPDRGSLRQVLYEAFGPGGTALLIEATSDNPNRTLAEVRSMLERNGGKMGREGSVGHLFTHCGIVTFDKAKNKQEDVLNFAQCIDALDLEDGEESYSVYFPFEAQGRVKECVGELVWDEAPHLDYRPLNLVRIEGEQARSLLSLITKLEGLDDVVAVYGNFDIPNEFLTQ